MMDAMRFIPIVALVPLLASCASSGLYDMSDNWCAAHLNASPSRCPSDRQRVADSDHERVADNTARAND